MRAQAFYADAAGNVYREQDLANDNGIPIDGVISTPEWTGGDTRIFKQFLDAFVDCIPAAPTGILVIPTSQGQAVGANALIGHDANRLLSTNPLGNASVGFPVEPMLGITLEWEDDFRFQTEPTTFLEWTAEAVPQPVYVRSWQSVPTAHGQQGYHFIYKIRFAYHSFGTVTLTITAFDGTSPQAITLPNTNGQYRKVEFTPTVNKALLYTYQGVSTHIWAPVLDSCEVLVGAWKRESPMAIFQGLGGVEAA